ncbi:unnamed protein product [Bursaphelenchus xylophilus]|uniref:eIF-4F 25 kDa subunit n=1 Tax=Bursaphelenchus xylophilus TaxID=6326 RepID=A0A1I7RRU6_BURXY|nr:unnamed protein product [Bursaphelenchus xylophilus]CAG9123466.1 unnamed protein product [Bursaphelenchus xylophilus]
MGQPGAGDDGMPGAAVLKEKITDSPDKENTVKASKDNSDESKNKKVERPLHSRHMLQHKWAFWFLKGDRTKNWEDCLKQVVVIDSVELFWRFYIQIMPASCLSFGSDYYLFKEGVKPMWEDPHNVNGGRWLVVVDKQQRHTKLDELWLELMMAVIGEQFKGNGKYICGAAVNLRQKGDKVALWTSDASLDDVNRKIGITVKNKLGMEDNIRYEVHKDASARTGSMVRPKIVLSKENRDNTSSKEKKSEVPTTP